MFYYTAECFITTRGVLNHLNILSKVNCIKCVYYHQFHACAIQCTIQCTNKQKLKHLVSLFTSTSIVMFYIFMNMYIS